jgi:hypothetical protein
MYNPPMERICIRCGAPLKENAIKYCSKRCYGDAKIVKVERTCESCGRTFLARRNAVAQGDGRFCSRSCVNRGRKIALDMRLDEVLGRCTRNENGCLLWAGTLDRAGYGIIAGDAEDNWKQLRASHLVYEKFVAPIPDGQYVLHRCDNPPCVEPDHLWLGSKGDNTRDMVTKGRNRVATGEDHPFAVLTEESVRRLRVDYDNGVPIPELVRRYGASSGAVYAAATRHTWRHVT